MYYIRTKFPAEHERIRLALLSWLVAVGFLWVNSGFKQGVDDSAFQNFKNSHIHSFAISESTQSDSSKSKAFVKIGRRDLGITIAQAIQKFGIDTAQAQKQHHPPGITKGMCYERSDSTWVYLQIERQSVRPFDFKSMLDAEIIGIGLAYSNCKTKFWGRGFDILGLYNPYCEE